MEYSLNKITGYTTTDNLISVMDKAGNPFYYYENPKGKKIWFNLPVGVFYSENDLTETRPAKYITPELPEADKNIIPKEMEFIVCDNPNKASIDVKTGKVFIDHSINEKAIPFKTFVFFHEVGHNYYTGGIHEHYCDIFAASEMLKRGFNKSQIYLANEFCLSDNAIDRKDYLYNWLKKVKQV